MRLLIIEDNQKLANFVKLGLEKKGFQLDVAYAGIEGEEKAYTHTYDAILLDLNLPDKDGLEILQFLRKENVESPIIIITARNEINERIRGLNLGADDYVTKPFELLELRARIQAVIRRFHGRTSPEININNLSINPASRIVQIDGKKIDLSVKEFDILETIAIRHPAIVSTEKIIEHVYDENFDPFSSVLRVHLSRLRKKLSDTAGEDILVTTRGKGYSLSLKETK